MRALAETVVQQLTSRLREHVDEMTNLRTAIDVHFLRIANMETARLLGQLPHDWQTVEDKINAKESGTTVGDSTSFPSMR